MAKPKIDYQLLVLKYLENELSPDERKNLEAEILKNPELKKEFQLQTKLNDFLKGKFMAEKAEQKLEMVNNLLSAQEENTGIDKLSEIWVNEWEKEKENPDNNEELSHFIAVGIKQAAEKENLNLSTVPVLKDRKNGKPSFHTKRIYAVLLLAAMLVISISLIWKFGTTTNNSELFATYYQPYHFMQEQNRGPDTVIVTAINEASESYQSGNYSKAAELIRKVLSADNKQVKAHFLSALISVETGKYSGASDEFNLIINQFDTYHIESKWYLALCYLKLNQNNKAKELLKELSLSKNFYQKRALEILDKM